MSGTKAGGQKIREANLVKNPNYYKELGRLGGAIRNPNKGFGTNRDLARTAGAKGGARGRGGHKTRVEPVTKTRWERFTSLLRRTA